MEDAFDKPGDFYAVYWPSSGGPRPMCAFTQNTAVDVVQNELARGIQKDWIKAGPYSATVVHLMLPEFSMERLLKIQTNCLRGQNWRKPK